MEILSSLCCNYRALKEGIGASLINKADLICEMIKEARKRVNYDAEYTVSAKIRIHDNMECVAFYASYG